MSTDTLSQPDALSQADQAPDAIDDVLAMLDSQPPTGSPETDLEATFALLDSQAGPDLPVMPEESAEAQTAPLSPVLEKLEPSRRPQIGNACATCPNSVWYASPTEVKAYCRVMYTHTWTTKEQNHITECDGVFLGQEG